MRIAGLSLATAAGMYDSLTASPGQLSGRVGLLLTVSAFVDRVRDSDGQPLRRLDSSSSRGQCAREAVNTSSDSSLSWVRSGLVKLAQPLPRERPQMGGSRLLTMIVCPIII